MKAVTRGACDRNYAIGLFVKTYATRKLLGIRRLGFVVAYNKFKSSRCGLVVRRPVVHYKNREHIIQMQVHPGQHDIVNYSENKRQ